MKTISEDGNLITVEADKGKFLDIGGGIGKRVITPKEALHTIEEITAKEADRRRKIYAGETPDE